jgi:hypothetical protein
MALVALATPTVSLVDPTLSVVATNVPGATGSALAGNTGFTVPWVPGLVVQIQGGAAGTGAVTVVNPTSGGPTPSFTLPATSQNVLYLVPQEFANPTTGLVQFNVTTVTNASAAAFLLLPNVGALNTGTGVKHNPFENNPQAADF